LHELDAIRPANDVAETGSYKPGIRSAIAYNTDSEIIPTIRMNGVLMGQITPRGGVISGTSSVMQFDAWNWEDALIKADDGVHLNWPGVFHKHYDKGKVSVEKVKTYDQQLREIHTFFNEARAYCSVKEPGVRELRFEGLRGVFDGSQKLYVHADDAKSIQESLNFKASQNIQHMVIVGGYDAHLVADQRSCVVCMNCPCMQKMISTFRTNFRACCIKQVCCSPCRTKAIWNAWVHVIFPSMPELQQHMACHTKKPFAHLHNLLPKSWESMTNVELLKQRKTPHSSYLTAMPLT
jgi:hypothetical protein